MTAYRLRAFRHSQRRARRAQREFGTSAAVGLDRARPRRSRALPAGIRAAQEPQPARRHAQRCRVHHQLPGRSASLPYRIISPHPEMPNIVGSFDCAGAGRHLVLNGHIDVFPVADDGAGWSQGPVGRRDRRRQDLRPRRRRHEGRHHGLDLHLCLSASAQGPAQGQADADGGLRRGDVRPVRRPLSDGASPRGARRRTAERRAIEPVQRALRREGAALARDHGQHTRRAWRLHACQQERDQDRDGDRRRAGEAGRDRAGAFRQRAHAPSMPGAPQWIAPWARAPAPSSTR